MSPRDNAYYSGRGRPGSYRPRPGAMPAVRWLPILQEFALEGEHLFAAARRYLMDEAAAVSDTDSSAARLLKISPRVWHYWKEKHRDS